ncbi:MAG: site-2 protease family protein [Verrucomicrobia bacterium]|nr:site-2 protease family protein [Verrucomicrobiota bacterium]
MSQSDIYNVLLGYLIFVPLITLHEWAHAWVAWKCGDNTAYDEGRVTINPIAHMEFVGTVVLPLMASFIALSNPALAGFIIGWGRPVPVNISNLRRPRIDDTLVTIAGPTMNFILAFALVAMAKAGVLAGLDGMVEVGIRSAIMSLALCFFNLIPIPPLDGSHILKNLIGMSQETYMRFYQFGFIAVLVVINIPGVRSALSFVIFNTLGLMASVFGLR